MFSLRDWRRRRLLLRSPLAERPWSTAVASLPLLRGLDGRDLAELRALTTIFIHEKSFQPVHDLEITPAMQLLIAAQACLPILRLGFDAYRDWSTLLIYPGEFVHRREEIDQTGVVHQWDEVRSGESWEYGPVILSWSDIEASGRCDGYNVVIHELAHKLDMLNGEADGYPSLPRHMSSRTWSRVFEAAFSDMNERLDRNADTVIDPYAAEHPAEFFAVLSEYFFEVPHLIQSIYPAVYDQLRSFYRQDPLRRLAPHVI